MTRARWWLAAAFGPGEISRKPFLYFVPGVGCLLIHVGRRLWKAAV